MIVIDVKEDFSAYPGPRRKSEGRYSAEEFIETVVLPMIKAHPGEDIVIDLDGPDAMGASFIEQTFGGMIRDYGIVLIPRATVHTRRYHTAIKKQMEALDEEGDG